MSSPSTPDPEQTLSLSQCPLCGFQPLPDGAVKCPRCQKTFTYALRQMRADIRADAAAKGPPSVSRRHISVDQEGNLYVAIFSNNKVGIEKYVPKRNADRSRLVGQPMK